MELKPPKSYKPVAEPPSVILTTHEEKDKLPQAGLATPFSYLLKPVRKRELEITIEMALYVKEIEKERRKIQDDLVSSDKKYRDLVDSASNNILQFDTRHRYDHAQYDRDRTDQKIAESQTRSPGDHLNRLQRTGQRN